MILNKEEKLALESIKKHPGYAVLLKIEEEARRNIMDFALGANLDDINIIKVLKERQIYCQARKDFLTNVNSHLTEIYGDDK